MTRERSPRQFDARQEGRGHTDANEGAASAHESSDSPARNAVAAPSAPGPTSDNRPDGVDELTRMEQNAEDGRE